MTPIHVQPSPSETTVIRAKDLMNIFGYKPRTAYKYLKDIKEEYNIKQVLYQHVKRYYHLT